MPQIAPIIAGNPDLGLAIATFIIDGVQPIEVRQISVALGAASGTVDRDVVHVIFCKQNKMKALYEPIWLIRGKGREREEQKK